MTEAEWQKLLSRPGRRRIEGGRVVATEPPALPPDAQAAADRSLLREAMLKEQLEAWIEQRATAPQGLSQEGSPPCSGSGHAGWAVVLARP